MLRGVIGEKKRKRKECCKWVDEFREHDVITRNMCLVFVPVPGTELLKALEFPK